MMKTSLDSEPVFELSDFATQLNMRCKANSWGSMNIWKRRFIKIFKGVGMAGAEFLLSKYRERIKRSEELEHKAVHIIASVLYLASVSH